jgi:hypothetical protein
MYAFVRSYENVTSFVLLAAPLYTPSWASNVEYLAVTLIDDNQWSLVGRGTRRSDTKQEMTRAEAELARRSRAERDEKTKWSQ